MWRKISRKNASKFNWYSKNEAVVLLGCHRYVLKLCDFTKEKTRLKMYFSWFVIKYEKITGWQRLTKYIAVAFGIKVN